MQRRELLAVVVVLVRAIVPTDAFADTAICEVVASTTYSPGVIDLDADLLESGEYAFQGSLRDCRGESGIFAASLCSTGRVSNTSCLSGMSEGDYVLCPGACQAPLRGEAACDGGDTPIRSGHQSTACAIPFCASVDDAGAPLTSLLSLIDAEITECVPPASVTTVSFQGIAVYEAEP